MTKKGPIGVFDSGIGGLTVAKAIRELMPNEDLVYFGDTAHLPYGEKSAEAVQQYSGAITEFLIGKGCKIIVIACNTASSLAYREVLRVANGRADVINVIDPLVDYIGEKMYHKLGVIGTRGTIKSKVYSSKIHAKFPNIGVEELATPLFANMIEEGFIHNEISHSIIESYLQDKKLTGVEALVLACTHYPLIKDEISEFFNHKVEIIDASILVAKKVKVALMEKDLLCRVSQGDSKFYMSVYTDSFAKSTEYFFGDELNFEELDLWINH